MSALTTLLQEIRFNQDGLIPAIIVDDTSGAVLMMAWMNKDALIRTWTSHDLYYWSRKRQCLWRKGESSGQTQRMKSLTLDCDGDTLLIRVDSARSRLPYWQTHMFFSPLA